MYSSIIGTRNREIKLKLELIYYKIICKIARDTR